jgi:hypothetical protein
MKFILLFSLMLSPVAFAGPSVSGGSDTFVNAVKGLRPLGRVYETAEKGLLAQGYVAEQAAAVEHLPTEKAGIEIFIIRQAFQKPGCQTCGSVVIEVTGQKRNDPPPPGEKDLFQVDRVEIVQD